MEEICRLAPPDVMRGEFLSGDCQEYDITIFDDNHELSEETEIRIVELSKQLYLYSRIDIWSLLNYICIVELIYGHYFSHI